MDLANEDDMLIETPWGKKRWGYIKRAMALENWMQTHAISIIDAIIMDITPEHDATKHTLTEEDRELVREYCEAHPNLGQWVNELQEAVFDDPEDRGMLN